jgi:murein DD-endopeptidase MepM/ murein hydrolase activator NlpD
VPPPGARRTTQEILVLLASVRPIVGRFVASTFAIVLVGGSSAAADTPPACLRPPVVGPVIDPFRAPACTWCPGNRGIDYGVPAGTVVHAAAAGTVSFAGAVAGTVWVTLGHAGGVASTYGPMMSLAVRRGTVVSAGEVLGTTSGAFHFGVRLDGRYIDPAPLLGRPPHLVPRLVPMSSPIRPVLALRCPAGGTGARVR